MKWEIRSFFKQKNGFSQEKLVMSMLRILSERDKGYLRELLFMCAEYYGNSTLSIICTEDRTIIATTAPLDCIEVVGDVALRLKNTDKRYHYFRNEKNGLYFRPGINCIRVIPLQNTGNKAHFLMVEQEKSLNPDMERVISLLSLATEIHLFEGINILAGKKDFLTGVKNRDALMDKLCEAVSLQEEHYLGMFFLENMAALNEKEGTLRVNDILRRSCEIMKKYFQDDVYRISGAKIGVWQKGGLYTVVSKLQDCLEELMLAFPQVAYGCVASPGTEEIYKTMYLCEKFIDKNEGTVGTVIVIREPEADFEDREEVKYYFLERSAHENMTEEEPLVYEEVPYEKTEQSVADDVEEKMEEVEESIEDLFQFWSDDMKIPDVCEDL